MPMSGPTIASSLKPHHNAVSFLFRSLRSRAIQKISSDRHALRRLHSPRGGSAPHRHPGTPRCRRGNADTKPRATELFIQVKYAVCLHMEPGWVPNPTPSGDINVTREATTIWQQDQGLMLKTKPNDNGLFKVMDMASHTRRTSQNSWLTSFKTTPKGGTPKKRRATPF